MIRNICRRGRLEGLLQQLPTSEIEQAFVTTLERFGNVPPVLSPTLNPKNLQRIPDPSYEHIFGRVNSFLPTYQHRRNVNNGMKVLSLWVS